MPDLFDYFSHVDLPTPTLKADEAERLCETVFGIRVTAQPLGSQQDQNFRIFDRDAGDTVGVLKLSNPAFSEDEIRMQDAATEMVAASDPALRVPRVVAGARGLLWGWWHTSQGRIHARVLENMSGSTLMGSGYLSPAVIERLGVLAARISRALQEFEHPASARVLQWNLCHAERVIRTLAAGESDGEVRAAIEKATADAAAILAPIADTLPRQSGHFDVTDDNVLHPEGESLPDAVIDFGDVMTSWRVAELAVSISSVLHHDGADPLSTLPAIRAFHALRPLQDAEITALWPLVVLRGATLVVSGRAQVRLDQANGYASAALDREFRIFEVATSIPASVMTEVIRTAVDPARTAPMPEWKGAPLAALPAETVTLDAGTISELNNDGAWMHPDTVDEAAAAALDAGAPAVLLPAWRSALTGAPHRTRRSPATVPTGVSLWLAEPLRIGRGDGKLRHDADALTWSQGDETVTILGLGHGTETGVLPARRRLWVQRSRNGQPAPPAMVTPGVADAWLSVAGDPAEALGVLVRPHANDDLLERRHRVLAEVQEHYYTTPPRIERGWREYLMDVDGRVYLDMVNNVASIGHAHPHLVAAATKQLKLLNTNSRFHYGVIAEYAERLARTLPENLDTVFFVNSGSEATDLAIRLAMAATGRPDIVAMREAYHGWTYASDAVSTSIADNPNALSTRPAWVHTIAAANAYRGEHRGEDAARYAPEAAAVIDALADAGRRPAALICETYFGNAGGVALPPGYLDEVYGAVRRHGGLAIADEVQVGFGRLGEWFWGFQQQNVVPDILAVAKSMGAGQPIGAVITTREIAARYRTQGYFFSSTGGSPVSAAIGLAVLDVIEHEGLQENARVVGGHLKSRLEELATVHPIIGAVHGSGLYLGVEFVLDRVTLEPATAQTAAICDRLLELGVIMQPTGDHLNVLKIKPPLCISRESVDYFADSLEHVLRTGW